MRAHRDKDDGNGGGRKALRWAFRAAALGGFLWIMAPPDQTLEDGPAFAPNDVQQEFLRLAAQKYDYVALGDTHHQRPEINIFAMHTDTVAALAAGGDRFYFNEAGPGMQPYMDALRTDPAAGPSFTYRWADSSMWICNADTRQRMTETFEASVSAHPEMTFIGADQRHNPDSEAGKAMRDNTAFNVLIGLPILAYDVIYGCVSWQPMVPGAIILAITGSDHMDTLTDDRDTAAFIHKTAPEGGAIFFGAGHFEGGDGKMEAQLRGFGSTVGHINIYSSLAHTESWIADPEQSDAYMIVRHEGDAQHGIRTNTTEMQALYEQAVANVNARRAAPAPFPGT